MKSPIEQEYKPQKFVITGKHHQLSSIARDLEEFGYRTIFDNNVSKRGCITHVYFNDHLRSLGQFAELICSDGGVTVHYELFTLPQDYFKAIQFAKQQIEHPYWKKISNTQSEKDELVKSLNRAILKITQEISERFKRTGESSLEERQSMVKCIEIIRETVYEDTKIQLK